MLKVMTGGEGRQPCRPNRPTRLSSLVDYKLYYNCVLILIQNANINVTQ